MISNQHSKIYKNKLPIKQLDQLLGSSAFFPSSEPPTNFRKLQAEETLSKASLYSLSDDPFSVPPLKQSRRAKKKAKKLQQSLSPGPKWFNMKSFEHTPENLYDLKALRLRRHLDPKHFYRKNDIKDLPKFFQIGTVINAPSEPISHSETARYKKKTLVEQLLEEDEAHAFSQKKWLSVMKSKPKKRKGPYKKRKLNK